MERNTMRDYLAVDAYFAQKKSVVLSPVINLTMSLHNRELSLFPF